MADPVVTNTEELPAGGISNAGPAIEPEDAPPPARNTAKNTRAPDPKNTKVITPDAAQDNTPDQPQGPTNETVDALKRTLGIKGLDPHMEEMLRTARLRLSKDGQALLVDLPTNGHCLHCGKMKDGSEFIGMPHKKMIVDEHDAQVMVALAKGRGWKAVNVSGNNDERERLWLEAQRQGLHVTNFKPDDNSAIAKKWAIEAAERAKAELESPQPSLTESKEEDFHLKTMKLLQDKATAATDKDVKTGLETVLKKFQDGAVLGTADIYKNISEALGDKTDKDGVKKAIDFLNKADPKLGLAFVETPAPVTQPAATASSTPKPETVAPA